MCLHAFQDAFQEPSHARKHARVHISTQAQARARAHTLTHVRVRQAHLYACARLQGVVAAGRGCPAAACHAMDVRQGAAAAAVGGRALNHVLQSGRDLHDACQQAGTRGGDCEGAVCKTEVATEDGYLAFTPSRAMAARREHAGQRSGKQGQQCRAGARRARAHMICVRFALCLALVTASCFAPCQD